MSGTFILLIVICAITVIGRYAIAEGQKIERKKKK